MSEKINHDANLLLEGALIGAGSSAIKINGIETRAVITKKYNSNGGNNQNIIGRQSEIIRGNLIDYQSQKWLITSLPSDNDVYRKAIITVCNATALIQTEATGELVDTGRKDMFDEPIYEEREAETLILPCIAETTIINESRNEAINLPEDRILITIPFQDFRYDQFEVYGKQYTVKGVDRTGSIDGVGVIKILGEERS